MIPASAPVDSLDPPVAPVVSKPESVFEGSLVVTVEETTSLTINVSPPFPKGILVSPVELAPDDDESPAVLVLAELTGVIVRVTTQVITEVTPESDNHSGNRRLLRAWVLGLDTGCEG